MPRDRADTAVVSAPAEGPGGQKRQKQKKYASKGSPLMTGGVIATSRKTASTRSIARRRDSGSSGCCTDAAAPPGDDTDSGDQRREDGTAYGGSNETTGRRKKTTRHERLASKAGGGESPAPVPAASAILAAGGVLFADESMYSIENASKLPSSREERSSDGKSGSDGRRPPPSQLEDLTPAAVSSAKHRGGDSEEKRSGISRSSRSSRSSRNSRSSRSSSSSDNPRSSSASPSTASSCCAATTPATEKTQLHSPNSRSPKTSQRHKTRGATSSSYVDKSLSTSKKPPVVDESTTKQDGSTSKRRKRRRPSNPLLANGGGEGGAPVQDKYGSINMHGGTAKADNEIYCPNAGSSLARDDVREVPAVATSHDRVAVSDTSRGLSVVAEPFPLSGVCEETEVVVPGGVVRGPKETAAQQYGEHPAPKARTSQHPEPEVNGGSNNVCEQPEEEQAVTRPAEPAAYKHSQEIVASDVAHRNDSVRRNNSVRRPRQEAPADRNAGSAGSKGGSLKFRRSPDERWRKNQGARAEATADQSPALGVKVIDRGTTKHLVLTTVDDVIGGDPGAGDRPRGPALLLVPRDDCRSSQAIGSRRREHQPRVLDPSEEERSAGVRDKLPKAAVSPRGDSPTAPLRGVKREQPSTVRQVDVEGGRVPLSLPLKHQPVVTAKQPPPWEKHPFVEEKLGTGPLQPAAVASPRYASGIAPVFSVGESISPQASPPRPAALPKNVYLVGDSRGSSPASSDASSFSGEPTVERTAKYVQQQASFHADGSESFIDEASSVEGSASPASPHRATPEIVSPSKAAADTTVAVSTVGNARPPGGGWVKVEEHRKGVTPAPSPPPAASWGNGAREGRRSRRTDVKTRRALTFPSEIGHPESPRRPTGRELSGAPLEMHAPTVSVDGEALARRDHHRDQNLDVEDASSPAFPKRSGSGGRQSGPPRSVDVCSGGGGSGGDLLHFRADFSRHLLSGGRPALFFLRPNESMAVTRVEGDGRLLVTLREEAGAAGIVVDGAVVHDSAAHFGHAAIQTDHRFPYVTGHRYEFQAVPAQGVGLAVNAGDTSSTADSGRSSAANPIGLRVVFSVMSAYNEEARLWNADARRLSLPAFQAPACLPPKPTPTETAGGTATATSAARVASILRRPSQEDSGRPERQPPPVRGAALTGPCIQPPSITEPADLATQLSPITPTPLEPEKEVASRSLAPNLQHRTIPGDGSGGVEETARRKHPRKAPPDDEHGDPSTRIAPASKNRFGFGVEHEHINKQELDTMMRGRGGGHRPPVATQSGSNNVGRNSDVEQRHSSTKRYANVTTNAADQYAPQRSNQTLGPPNYVELDYPRREMEASEISGGHSTEQLRWNSAWERQSPSPREPASSQSSLPHIRQQAEPQSAFGHLDSGSNRTPRDVNARDRIGRPPPYGAEPPRRKRHTAGAEGEAERYGPRPINEAHRDIPPAAYRDHAHRDHAQYATLPDRRRFDDERRPVFSPQDGSSSAREDDGRNVTPDGRWDYRLRQRPVEGKHLAPDGSPSDLRPRRRYDRRASEGGEPRADRRRWREDERLTTGNTHDPRRNAPRDPVAADGSQWTRRIPEKGPGSYDYQAYERRAAAHLHESGRDDALQLSEASRWNDEPPRDPWRGARSTKGRGEHAMGSTEEAFGGKRGYPQVRRTTENPRMQRGGEEVRYGRAPMGRKRPERQHPAYHTGTELSTYRKPRHDVGSNVAQIGVHGGSSDRTPPRWNKF